MALRLILASSSRYRAQLLARLGVEFETVTPNVDERRLTTESAREATLRLARAKAQAVASRYEGALVVGSDQLAELDGEALGKPGTEMAALAQLQRLAGRTVNFHTGVCLWAGGGHRVQLDSVRYEVSLRKLSPEAIQRYVAREAPLDCAGSFRSEGLGIALFERMAGDDPTALIGLPLIRLVAMLEREGLQIP